VVNLIRLVLSEKPKVCRRTLTIAGRDSSAAVLRLNGPGLLSPTHMPTSRIEE
jgi:hypothetical protein